MDDLYHFMHFFPGGLILKLETDPHLNWHSFLDSYALISGQNLKSFTTLKTCFWSTLKQLNLRGLDYT